MGNPITSFRDLEVYQILYKLNHRVFKTTLTFPDFEKYELGSQLRRSANSSPANRAEGWNNRHINIYLEGINRALGELHETQHHLSVACQRDYISEEDHKDLEAEYERCGRMLKGLQRSLENRRDA